MLRNAICVLYCTTLFCIHANAQLAAEFDAPPSNCCLAMFASRLSDQLQDWNQLGRYHMANRDLMKAPAAPNRVVFMGDSITDLWKLDEWFKDKPYVNRGIGGQTTPQMLARTYADVIMLKPRVMVLLGGINDIARNTGPMTAEMIQQNIMAMTELAHHHGIKVVLCSLLPVSDYPYEKFQRADESQRAALLATSRRPMAPMKMTTGHPPDDILRLNEWIKDYAQQVDAIFLDYFTALVDERGWLKETHSDDGIHPNAEGYKAMAVLVEAAITTALR